MEQDTPNISPEHILQLKDELMVRWRQLPVEHQASMTLVLLKDVIAGEYGEWMQEAMTLGFGDVNEGSSLTT
jgi:hypothetical protein